MFHVKREDATSGVAGRREVAWAGLGDEDRLDVVSVEFLAGGGLVATGTQSTECYRAQWDLAVDHVWRTRVLTLDVEATSAHESGVWQRHLNLWRDDAPDGRSAWRCETGQTGAAPADMSAPGFHGDAQSEVSAAVDVDLAGCPMTNTMPIRRFEGLPPGSPERHITTAWISLPDLSIRAAAQVYSPAADGLAHLAAATREDVHDVVHYHSLTREVAVDLTVDEDGLVVTYPGLATRLPLE